MASAKEDAGYLRHGFIAFNLDDAHVALAINRQLEQGADVFALGAASLVAVSVADE